MTEATRKDLEQDRAIRAVSIQLDEFKTQIGKDIGELRGKLEALETSLLSRMAESNQLIAEDILKLSTHTQLKQGVTPLELHAQKKG